MTSTMNPKAYLTVIRTKNACNKIVTRDDDGNISKTARGANIGKAEAKTVRVPDVHAMQAVLMVVGSDPNMAIIQGFVKGTEPAADATPDPGTGLQIGTKFRIWSVQQIETATGEAYTGGWVQINGKRITARLKINFEPSSWQLLDRDYASGLPPHLAALTAAEWEQAMARLIPDFDRAGWVRLNSTSSRVLVDGQPLSCQGAHYWFQVDDPHDDTLGSRLLLLSAVHGLAFRKINKAGAETTWSIFDPTVFCTARLVFDGQPLVQGAGLTLAPPDITVQVGPVVITKLVPDLSPSQEQAIRDQHGIRVQRSRGAGKIEAVVDTGQLTMQTPIETKDHGVKTPADFWASDDDKWRCQATFRDSNSWNGFLARDAEGLPRLFDNGTRTWHVLARDAKEIFRIQAVSQLVQNKDLTRLTDEPALRLMAAMEEKQPAAWLKIRMAITKAKLMPITQLEKAMRACRAPADDAPGDAPIELTHAVLREIGTGNLVRREDGFWRWNDDAPGAWRRVHGDQTWLGRIIHDVLKQHKGTEWGAADAHEIQRLVGPECYLPGSMNLDTSGVNVANGELHLVNGSWELRPHRKSIMNTVLHPVVYDPDAVSPSFDAFLADVLALPEQPNETLEQRAERQVQEKARINLAQQHFGNALTRHALHERCVFLYGQGSNGKTVLLYVLEHLIGRDNVIAVQPSEYGNRFQKAKFNGASLNIVYEVSKGEYLDDASLKALVSGETMTVEDKGIDPYEIYPFAKLWHATNHIPKLKDTTNAILRRVDMLELFQNYETRPDRDPNLKRWLVENELPGILNWALEGLRQIETTGWVECAHSRHLVREWLAEADSIGLFLEQHTEKEPTSWIPNDDLMPAYREFCRTMGLGAKSATEVGKELRAIRGVNSARRNGKRGWTGIRFVDRSPTAVPVTPSACEKCLHRIGDACKVRDDYQPGDVGACYSFEHQDPQKRCLARPIC